MRGDPRWLYQDAQFWAYVKVISEKRGYAKRGADAVSTYTLEECKATLEELGRSSKPLDNDRLGDRLIEYFNFRADSLNSKIKRNLMNAEEAADLFKTVTDEYCTDSNQITDRTGKLIATVYDVEGGVPVRVPMNKQKGVMRAPSYLTGIVNILFSKYIGGESFEDDPRRLPVVDHEGELYGAMSRRLDGAYPSSVNPIALWEIKEYYYTTTFGSKISDAVYITALDGLERNLIQQETDQRIDLYLFIDAYATWWNKGKAYLCRLFDLAHRGVINEVVVGREAVEAIPRLVSTWDRSTA